MYKTVNLKTKLFTKLTNQNWYYEARAIGYGAPYLPPNAYNFFTPSITNAR